MKKKAQYRQVRLYEADPYFPASFIFLSLRLLPHSIRGLIEFLLWTQTFKKTNKNSFSE